MAAKRLDIGGQAVIEGVMMRSPKAMAIAVRRPSGQVAVKEEPWRSLSQRLKFLRWPVLRGAVVFIEALVNGIQALSYSANQALEEEEGGPLSPWAIGLTIVLALGLAMVIFVAAPHLISLASGLGVRTLGFHLIDGLLKVAFFVAYILGISLLKDVRRMFMYHGAEHMSIHAYEAGQPLTVESARHWPTLHPRCGTAFILLVLVISIIFFALVFPFLPRPEGSRWLVNLFFLLVKVVLMLPIAGLAYELIRQAGRRSQAWWVRVVIWPGLLLQRLTTRKPTDDQIEIALTALKSALKIEDLTQRGQVRP